MRELREAARSLWRTPMVTIVAILSLALGVGATTAIYSIVDSLLLRPLPVRNPERLVRIVDHKGQSVWSNPVWEEIRNRASLFDGAISWSPAQFDLAASGESDLIDGLWVSGGYFRVLGVTPARGRLIEPGDDHRGGGADGPVAVISAGFWQRRFGGSNNVIGQRLAIGGVEFTIVGVTPASFFGTTVGGTFDVAVPLGTEPSMHGRGSLLDAPTSWLNVMGRLGASQTVESAAARLDLALPGIRAATMPAGRTGEAAAQYMKNGMTVAAAVGGASTLRETYRRSLYTILGVVLLVLLIACANIANLLMARANTRQHELTVRAALGAAPFRLARQLLTESLLLAVVGAGLALGIARWSSEALVKELSTPGNHVYLDLSTNLRVLGFTMIVAVLTALLFGVAPALRTARVEPMDVLRKVGRGSGQVARSKFATGVVVAQIALSLVLVNSAGLFVRTFANLENARFGFEPSHVLLAHVNAQRLGLNPADRPAFYERVRQSLLSVPGVTDVGASRIVPVSGSTWMTSVRLPQGGADGTAKVSMNMITPDWFGSYGAHVMQGRDFDSHDVVGTARVAIVNRAFVRQYLTGDGIGQSIGLPGKPDSVPPLATIVGVVGDAVYRAVRDPIPPTVYVPVGQQSQIESAFAFSLRASTNQPAVLEHAVSQALVSLDPKLSVMFRSLSVQIEATFTQERLLAMISALFGLLALLLAGLGLYGVTSHSVSQRRGELGVRMALGTPPSGVAAVVIRRVGWQLSLGLGVGMVLSLGAAGFVSSLLFAITPMNALTLAGSAIVLAMAAMVACVKPAHRAFTIDPIAELRAD